jgi:multiple sugar transport system permease protein
MTTLTAPARTQARGTTLRVTRNPRGTRPLLWLLLVLVVVLYAFPFAYLVLTSFKTPLETIAVPPRVLPGTWTLENYTTALSRSGVVPSFINSLSTALISTTLSLGLALPAAYGISRYRTRAGRVFVMFALVTRMVPPVAIGVPLVGLMTLAGLRDTPTGVALAHATISLPLSIWLMSSFFEAVPEELEEAARVDGCSRMGALVRVVIPVVSGGVAVTAIFAFLASWNEFLFSLLLTANRAQTTPIVIANFQTQFGLDWGAMTALATLYSVPVVLVTLVLQRKIVAGLTLGAVKG